MGLRARIVPLRGSQSDDLAPERALLAAILIRAIRDARRGDAAAAAWLARSGADLADCYFDVHPNAFIRWADGAAHKSARARRYQAARLIRGLRMTVTARTHYRDPRGFVIELAITGETGAELLPGVSKTLDALMQQGCKPVDPFTEPTAAEVARNPSRAQLAKSTPGQGPGGRLFPDR